jgi:AcrR family transcriptional regulator
MGSNNRGSDGSKGAPPKGRPKKDASHDKIVHDALLSAAERCLEDNDASVVTVRQIAQMAGVNQAMIHYYFESKDGLFVSLYESDIDDLSRQLSAFLKAIDTDEDGLYTIEALMKRIEDHFCEHKSMFAMIHHEMMDAGSMLSRIYNRRLAARGYSTIIRIVAALMAKGRCRTDLTPEHTAYLICSVCSTPFLLRPIFNAAFNTKEDDQGQGSRRRAMARLLEVVPESPLPR